VPEIAFIYITPVGGTLCLLRHIDVDARVRKGEPVSRLGCQPDKLTGVFGGVRICLEIIRKVFSRLTK
jgi:hypothetical protein